MAATLYTTKTVSSSKAAEIYREDSGKIYYVCFHCGFDSDNITDILVHIDIHFTSNDVQSEDLVVKCELIDQDSHEVLNPAQIEQIFIDCGTKPKFYNEQCFTMDTSSDVFLPEPQKSPVTEENFKNMDGLFEWKCLHCQSLFKKYTKLKQHLIKHNSNDPVLRVIKGAANNEKAVTTKAHYSFKCTLCSSEFYDSLSSEQHLKDFHAAPPPIKCITCCETFCSTEMLTEHMSTIHSNSSTKEEVLPAETKKRNEIPAEAKTKQCLCIFCNKTFIGTLEYLQHTFGHFNLKPFSCPECPSKFQRINTFNGHMKARHHLRIEYKYLCRFCNDNVDYFNLLEFVTHAFTHHLDDGDRNNSNLDSIFYYHCRFCFEKFNKWSDACTHLKKNHAEDELSKGLPSAAMTSGRILTERAKSGSYRSEFLHNCDNCSNTLCGSYEARKHSITEHGNFEHVTEKRWVTELIHYSKPVAYRILQSKESPDKGSIKCYDCDSSFDSKIHLMRHRLMHFNVKPYQCTICSQSFSSRSHITRHTTKEHDMKEHRQFSCKFCSAEFTEDSEFITHNFDDHLYESFNIGENLDTMCKYECLYCSDVILERDLLDQHLQAHIDEVILETKGVQDTGSDESSVNRLRHNIEFMYVCLHCPKKFRLPFVASSHAKFSHKVERYELPIKDTHCDLCDITFLTWRSLINHRAKLHPETITRKPQSQQEKNVCQTTKKKKKRRTPEGNNCNICNITFLTNRSMINHRTKRHPETVVTPKNRPIYTCKIEICGKTFRERSNFNHHMETHVKRHSFTCDICNKTYRLKNSLQTHMLIHTKEKNFVCEECGKNFYTTSKLNLHKQVHENLTFKCEKCDKVFYTRNNFSKHKKTHIENVRKKCKICANTFKSSVSLRVHMFLHDGTKKYGCRYCDQTFAQSSGRRGHEKSRHGFV